MWQRGMNWTATVLVGGFGILWLGVMVFAAEQLSMWARIGQAFLGVFLIGWAFYKAGLLLRRTEPKFTPRHRRVRA
ncbi:hypothetical protein ACFFMN_31135 [Planobispora siamensis]|uniref:Uncharacterized protein n=1 Tax=Planobispora siamensis TaxID=936338 RepID=A0A8J3SDY4_9ACTN|nr:hypothetical protein [Planobispora siamensis]GIH91350.1 hypothetical protein Psi01_19800 [Planobispora siamensis]